MEGKTIGHITGQGNVAIHIAGIKPLWIECGELVENMWTTC